MAPSFIAISFLYFFFNHPDALICLKGDRNAKCSSKYDPVCATFACKDSPTGYCQETINNGCVACKDKDIVGYILGACPSTPIKSCSTEEESECSNTDVEGTVCGITPGKSKNTISKVIYKNGCDACNKGNVDFYLGGEAHDQCLVVSTDNVCKKADRDTSNCADDDALLACVYYTGNGCTEPICRKNAKSWCYACGETGALFYLNGSCEDNVPIPDGGIPVGDDDSSDNNDGSDADDSDDYEPKKKSTKNKKSKKL